MLTYKKREVTRLICASLLIFALPFTFAFAQAAQGLVEVHGTVADSTGAVIGGANITLADDAGHKYTTKSDDAGNYRITGIVKGSYSITVDEEGFTTYTQKLDLSERTSVVANVTMEISVKEVENINADNPGISTDPDANLSGITLSPAEIAALPDDPDDLLTTLRQMAGPTEDAQIYVDGYREGGRLPPKEAILTIRINNNPFSAQFTEPGFGRIEIVTKPGTSDYHGGARFNFNDEYFNGRSAFALERTPLSRETYNLFFTGPIIKNKWDFFANFERRDLETDTVVSAINPAPPFGQLVTSIGAPQTLDNYEIRTNYLVTSKNTVGLWYRHTSNVQDDQGLTGLNLPDQEYTSIATDNTLRLSVTSVATESAVNEIRTEFSRRPTDIQAVSDTPQVSVGGAFVSGGNQGDLLNDTGTYNLAFSDDLTYTHKVHTFKFGFRTDASEIENTNRSNFGGSFLFSGSQVKLTNGNTVNLSPLQQYECVVAPGDCIVGAANLTSPVTPNQFSIITGNDFVGLTQWDYAWYANDDWKVSQSFNMSLGIRQELQTHLGHKDNFAPRFSFAWSPDKQHKSTIRGGTGIFYTIVVAAVTQAATLGNGVEQHQIVIPNPDFFLNDIPTSFPVTPAETEITEKDPDLRMPYLWMSTVSYERSLPLKLQFSAQYSYQRGVHLLREVDLNQPFDQYAATFVRPDPNLGAVLDVQSTGASTRNELRFTINRRLGKVLLFGNYTYSRTYANTDAWTTVAENTYDLASDWGRAAWDYRNRAFFGGNVSLRYGITVAPYIFAQTGGPYNIIVQTTGYNEPVDVERPAFAAPGTPDAILTPYGLLNPHPTEGDSIIPRNFGQTPGNFTVNLNLGKTFGLGPKLTGTTQGMGGRGQGGGLGGGRGGFGGPGGGPISDSGHKYSLTVYMYAQNLLNHVNLTTLTPLLASPLFNDPEAAAAARVITMGIRFNF